MTCRRGRSHRTTVSRSVLPFGRGDAIVYRAHRALAAISRWLRGLGRRSHDKSALDLPLAAQFELAQIGFKVGAFQGYLRLCREVLVNELVDVDRDLFGDTTPPAINRSCRLFSLLALR